MKIYKIRITTPAEQFTYDVWSPELGLRVCDEAVAHTGKVDNDVLAQLRQLFTEGHWVLVISNGTILDVDGIPRGKIPEGYVMVNADAFLGDVLVVKPGLTKENFEITIVNG